MESEYDAVIEYGFEKEDPKLILLGLNSIDSYNQDKIQKYLGLSIERDYKEVFEKLLTFKVEKYGWNVLKAVVIQRNADYLDNIVRRKEFKPNLEELKKMLSIAEDYNLQYTKKIVFKYQEENFKKISAKTKEALNDHDERLEKLEESNKELFASNKKLREELSDLDARIKKLELLESNLHNIFS